MTSARTMPFVNNVETFRERALPHTKRREAEIYRKCCERLTSRTMGNNYRKFIVMKVKDRIRAEVSAEAYATHPCNNSTTMSCISEQDYVDFIDNRDNRELSMVAWMEAREDFLKVAFLVLV